MELSKKEQLVLKYLNQNKEELIKLSINDIASNINVSSGLISSLIRKIGYTNYKEYKKSLIFKNNKISEIRGSSSRIYLELHDKFNDKFDNKFISKFSKQIFKKKTLTVIAYGYSSIVSNILKYKLMEYGIYVKLIKDQEEMQMHINMLPNEEPLLIITMSGKTKIINQLIDDNLNQEYLYFITNNPTASVLTSIKNYHILSNEKLNSVDSELLLIGTFDHLIKNITELFSLSDITNIKNSLEKIRLKNNL